MTNQQHEQLMDIEEPHNHDVLCGRGNSINFHAGNEFFRSLVKGCEKDYATSPKQEKKRFSTMIVEEIRSRIPPGRFLKQKSNKTGEWYDIGLKKALEKTRQALRENVPEMMKTKISDLTESDMESEGCYHSVVPPCVPHIVTDYSLPQPPVPHIVSNHSFIKNDSSLSNNANALKIANNFVLNDSMEHSTTFSSSLIKSISDVSSTLQKSFDTKPGVHSLGFTNANLPQHNRHTASLHSSNAPISENGSTLQDVSPTSGRSIDRINNSNEGDSVVRLFSIAETAIIAKYELSDSQLSSSTKCNSDDGSSSEKSFNSPNYALSLVVSNTNPPKESRHPATSQSFNIPPSKDENVLQNPTIAQNLVGFGNTCVVDSSENCLPDHTTYFEAVDCLNGKCDDKSVVGDGNDEGTDLNLIISSLLELKKIVRHA